MTKLVRCIGSIFPTIVSDFFNGDRFFDSFNLPENIIGDQITSKYENGILRIEIPKNEVIFSKLVKQITVT